MSTQTLGHRGASSSTSGRRGVSHAICVTAPNGADRASVTRIGIHHRDVVLLFSHESESSSKRFWFEIFETRKWNIQSIYGIKREREREREREGRPDITVACYRRCGGSGRRGNRSVPSTFSWWPPRSCGRLWRRSAAPLGSSSTTVQNYSHSGIDCQKRKYPGDCYQPTKNGSSFQTIVAETGQLGHSSC